MLFAFNAIIIYTPSLCVNFTLLCSAVKINAINLAAPKNDVLHLIWQADYTAKKKGVKGCSYDIVSSAALSGACLAEMTRSRVWSGTAIPAVSKSATIAIAASSSPRSTHKEIISSYRLLQIDKNMIRFQTGIAGRTFMFVAKMNIRTLH